MVELSRNKKIGYTVLIAIVGIIFISILSGGTELGNLIKIPSLGTSVIANVDVERTLFDVRIVKTSIDIHQGVLSVGKPLGISGLFIGEKNLFLKMYVRGQLCALNEFSIKGTGVQSNRLSCGKQDKGEAHVRIDLLDTKGLEDRYETTILLK